MCVGLYRYAYDTEFKKISSTMLRVVSKFLGENINLSSTASANLTPTGTGTILGKFILYNSALPIQTTTVALESAKTNARGELVLDSELDARGKSFSTFSKSRRSSARRVFCHFCNWNWDYCRPSKRSVSSRGFQAKDNNINLINWIIKFICLKNLQDFLLFSARNFC